MQSVKSFLALGTDKEYNRMNREAFLFRLINYFDGTDYDNGCPLPDSAVGADGEAVPGYKKVPLTLAQKRRLRNEVIREAKKLATSHNKTHKTHVEADDYQVLLHAFFKTSYGSTYNRLRHEWGVKSAEFEPIDFDTKERSNLSSAVNSKKALKFISLVEEWDTGDAVLISPYDPLFVKSDAFTDETDNLACAYYPDGIDDDTVLDTVYLSTKPDKYRFVSVTARDKIASTFKAAELEGPLVRSGYYGINHFIKTQKGQTEVRNFLLEHADSVSEQQRDFMVEACKYMTSIGVEFDIVVKDDALALMAGADTEVRLLDTKDGILYSGRMFINGHAIRLGYQKSNKDYFNPLDYITNEDRINVLKWYFGGESIPVKSVTPAGKNGIKKSLKVGNYDILDAKANAPFLSNRGSRTSTAKHADKYSRGNGGESTFLLAYLNPKGTGGIGVNIMIQPFSSTSYRSSELDFRKSIPVFDNIPVTPEGDNWDIDSKANQAWLAYAETLDINQIVDSDIEVDSSIVDADGNPVRRVKPFVDPANVSYYQHLPVRNTLNAWVESAKENHRKLFDFDGLKKDYEAYLADKSFTLEGGVDESIDELRALYWRILIGEAKEKDIRSFMDDIEMSGAEDEEGQYDDAYDDENAVVKDYTDGLDFSVLKSGSLDDKLALIQKHYENYLSVEFGTVPELPKPGEEPDYDGKGFNPEKVARYVNTDKSAGVQKNYDYIRHMLHRLDDYYDESWISSSNYISKEIKNDMIKYDESKELIRLGYSDVNITDARPSADHKKAVDDFAKSHPTMFEMMKHTIDMLATSGCDAHSIRLSIDENGIMHYSAKQTNGTYSDKSDTFLQGDKLISIDGYIGQIFEPDEHGVIDPKYVVPTDSVFVPGYNAYLVENDPDNPQDLRDRLRLSGWKKQMRMAITKEIRSACTYSTAEYNFVPRTTSLNRVYRKSYDTRINRRYYLEHLNDPTFVDIIETLKGRCRFPNSYDKGATTEAQSMLEHPGDEKSKRYDFYYSDLCDNENLRVMGEYFDGIFDPDMTGTARTQGIVRYLVKDATVDDVTGKVNDVAFSGDNVPKCALMANDLFRNKDFDTWDRREMAASQTLTAWHTPRHVGTAMMTLDGWTFDDGFVVSKKFAETYQVPVGGQNGLKQDEVEYRPLMAQDKLSDFHGNKGVIGLVVDPDLASDVLAEKLIDAYVQSEDYDFSIAGLVEDMADVSDSLNDVPEITLSVNGVDYTTVFDNTSSDSRAVQVAKSIRSQMLLNAIGYDAKRNVGTFEYEGKTYNIQFDDNSTDDYVTQMAKRIQREYGVEGLDDIMHFFGENPNLDVVMAPYSGMSRFNGGSIRSLMEEPADLTVNGKTIDGGMGYTDLIVVDMLADVKSHFYDDDQIKEGKGRKASAQLAWALQAKGANVILNEFYGSNGKAFDNLREYAIAIGLDFTESTEPVIGYTPQTGRYEKRRLFKLPSADSVKYSYVSNNGGKYFLDESYNSAMVDDILSKLNESGGFLELPFQLDFKTLDFVAGSVRLDDEDKEKFKLLPTGQTYTDANGKTYPTYGLPVLSASLRSGQDFQDGTSKPHDYTKAYVDIYRQAVVYAGYEAQVNRINAKKAEAGADVDKLNTELKALETLKSKCVSSAQASFDTIVKDVVQNRFDTKYNVVREEIMAKRINHSATAVWSADTRLKSDEISMSEENAIKLGLLKTEKDENGVERAVYDEFGNPVFNSDNPRVLVWRDPILHDGNVRLMNVVIDKRNLKGVCINPLMDASFDGDFDGDSVAIVALGKEAANQAYTAFAFENNLLNKGLKDTIVNPETGETMVGYPLYIQKGLDRAANEVIYDAEGNVLFDKSGKPVPSEYKKQIDMITWNINKLEALAKEWQNSSDPDRDSLVTFEEDVVDKRSGKTRHKIYHGSYAITKLRQAYKAQIDAWMQDVLKGIGTDHVVVQNENTVMKSCQHMVDNKSKGSQSKLKDLMDNLGIKYGLGKDGRADLKTIETIVDALGHVCSLDTANGLQRAKDKAIQETAAYKADNTQLGGTAAQRGVSAFRDENLTATLELTYPVTQAILQSKHDPKDAKIKDEIVRFWGTDVWNGYKLTGDWTNSEGLDSDDFIKKLQTEAHQKLQRFVLDENGEKIPVKERVQDADGSVAWVEKKDAYGLTVYQTEYVKCTREEWIAQMEGMFTALKVDINPDYISDIADIMIREEPSQAVSAVTGSRISVYDKGLGATKPLVSQNVNTVMGLDEYIAEKGALIDKMGYFGKAGALITAAADNSKNPEASQPTSVTALMGDIYSYISKVKAAEQSVLDAERNIKTASAEAKAAGISEDDSDEVKAAKVARKDAKAALREVKSTISNSASFLASSVATEVYHDKVREDSGAEKNVIVKLSKGEEVTVEKAPVPMGRSDCRLTVDDFEQGIAYMGESQASYEKRVLDFEKYRQAKNAEEEAAKKASQADEVLDISSEERNDAPYSMVVGS